ncbi:hypothetical protein Syun_008211 [Stephania yunnanensis]|uniref:Diacylglycerol O-acyltransferase 3, cytosolic n=1 Tax=Stephania yunnanensis TaxID=152371 RepID=A0AAP0L0Z3_9MAGN
MEVSGLVYRPAQFSKTTLFSGRSSINGLNRGFCNVSVKPRNPYGVGVSGFSDDGHLKYYESTRREVKKNNDLVVEEKTEKKKIKKKLKYLKGLSRNMLMFPEMVLDDENSDGLVQDDVRNTISEATIILLGQLKQLKAEKKQQKRKRKEEKQKLRAAQMKTTRESRDSSSSSSSSESSDDEPRMVVNMSRLRSSAMADPLTRTEEKAQSCSIEAQPVPTSALVEPKPGETPVEKFLCQSQMIFSEPKIQVRVEPLQEQICCTTSSGISVCGDAKAERIDVCVGGKCRKMGGAALLEEFERAVGMKGSVVGCKCMGKCRSGPNVKVHASQDDGLQGGNPLYIGVGLEDVGAIVSQIFGEKRSDLGLVPT